MVIKHGQYSTARKSKNMVNTQQQGSQ